MSPLDKLTRKQLDELQRILMEDAGKGREDYVDYFAVVVEPILDLVYSARVLAGTRH